MKKLIGILMCGWLLGTQAFAMGSVVCGKPDWRTKCVVEADIGHVPKCNGWGNYRVTMSYGRCNVTEDECQARVQEFLKNPYVDDECGLGEFKAKSVEYRFEDRFFNLVSEGIEYPAVDAQ